MRRFILSLAGLMLASAGALAGDVQTLTINGETLDKVVTKLTFSGDIVTLHFGSETAAYDMESVVISFDATQTDISRIEAFEFNGLVGDVLHLSGVAVGNRVAVFDLQGREVIATVASDSDLSISVSSLGRGVYLLSAGNTAVKFVKR